MRINKKTIGTIILIIISLAALAYAIRTTAKYPRWVVDDAYIVFRYAENLAEHGELNWNVGENRTEGYTGIVLPYLMTLAIKAGISPVLATHILGIFFYFCGGVILLLILRGFNPGSAVALALYFTAPAMFTHAWSGIETTMFITAMLLCVYAFKAKRERLFLFSLLLLSFTRPEGVVLSVILLILYQPLSYRLVLMYVIPCLIYFIWRWAYYDQFLPNTFYAKRPDGSAVAKNIEGMKVLLNIIRLKTMHFAKQSPPGILQRNYKDFREFVDIYLIRPALVALVLISWDEVKKHKYLIAGILAFACITTITYLPLNLTMNYGHRFYIPLFIFSILAIGGMVKNSKMPLRIILVIIFLVLPQINKNIKELNNEKEYTKSYQALMDNVHSVIGNYIRENIPSDEWLLVHSDAGAIPYYSKLKTVDFGRLNDEYLARNRPNITDAAEYFYAHNAGVVVFTSYRNDMVDHGPEAHHITQDERFEDYSLIKKYSCKERRRYSEFVYIRKDLIASLGINVSENESKRQPDTEGTDTADRERTRRSIEKKPKSPEELWEAASLHLDPRKKIRDFEKFLDQYPDHEYAPRVLLMMGFVYSEELKDTARARKLFNELVEKYPGSDVVETAKWMIENMDKPPPDFKQINNPDVRDTLDTKRKDKR